MQINLLISLKNRNFAVKIKLETYAHMYFRYGVALSRRFGSV